MKTNMLVEMKERELNKFMEPMERFLEHGRGVRLKIEALVVPRVWMMEDAFDTICLAWVVR